MIHSHCSKFKSSKGHMINYLPSTLFSSHAVLPKGIFWGAHSQISSSGILCKYIQLLEREISKIKSEWGQEKQGVTDTAASLTRWKFPKEKIIYTDLLWDFSVLDFTHLLRSIFLKCISNHVEHYSVFQWSHLSSPTIQMPSLDFVALYFIYL